MLLRTASLPLLALAFSAAGANAATSQVAQRADVTPGLANSW